MYIIPRAISR